MTTRHLAFTLGLFATVTACSGTTASPSTGSSGSSGSSGSPASTGAATPACYDGAGNPAATCAVAPAGDACALGDANACSPLTTLAVYADDGKNGVCVHLVYTNQCSSEIYADTCIEHQDSASGAPTWECWTSSVLPGFTVDVSQCHATGKYFEVASASSGQLDLDEQKCPAPSP